MFTIRTDGEGNQSLIFKDGKPFLGGNCCCQDVMVGCCLAGTPFWSVPANLFTQFPSLLPLENDYTALCRAVGGVPFIYNPVLVDPNIPLICPAAGCVYYNDPNSNIEINDGTTIFANGCTLCDEGSTVEPVNGECPEGYAPVGDLCVSDSNIPNCGTWSQSPPSGSGMQQLL